MRVQGSWLSALGVSDLYALFFLFLDVAFAQDVHCACRQQLERTLPQADAFE